MKTKKDRRHSGRKTYFSNDNDYPTQQTFWDDWTDYRDGLRGSKDKTLIRKKALGYDKKMGNNLDPKIKENNQKLKKYSKIRKARKEKSKIRYGPAQNRTAGRARCKQYVMKGKLFRKHAFL